MNKIERRHSDARARHDELIQVIDQMASNATKRLWLSSAAFFAMGVVVGLAA